MYGFIKDPKFWKETKKGNTFAVVINTGFATHRGQIIRKILNRSVKDPDILRTTLIFVL